MRELLHGIGGRVEHDLLLGGNKPHAQHAAAHFATLHME